MLRMLALVSLAVLGLALLVVTFRILPMVVLFAWPARVRVSFEDDWLPKAFDRENSALVGLLEDFKTLGFSLIGLKVERMPLWGPSFRELALVSEPGKAYASIVLHPDLSAASKYCFTPFDQDGMVFTRDFGVAEEAESERLSVKNVPGATPAELVSSHIQRVEMLCERGLTSLVGDSREARLEATQAFYSSAYAKRTHRRVWWPRIRRWLLTWGVFFLLVAFAFLYLPSL